MGETSSFYISRRVDDILVDCCILIKHFGSLAEDTLRNLNPVSSQAVIKGKHLLVDKLISTKYECHSRIPLVAACNLKEIG